MPIRASMDTRTFTRHGSTVTLTRERTTDGVALVAFESGRRRTFTFSHIGQLVRFQCDMEAFLQRTGWSPLDEASAEGAPAGVPAATTALARRDTIGGLRLRLEEEEV